MGIKYRGEPNRKYRTGRRWVRTPPRLKYINGTCHLQTQCRNQIPSGNVISTLLNGYIICAIQRTPPNRFSPLEQWSPTWGEFPPGGNLAISGGGDEQLSKTIQHLFGLKIHLIYNYKASDSLNFHEIKFN